MDTTSAASALTAPEAITRRRATRKFDASRPLPDELLKRILSLATHAPSGFNLQPWRFLVVRSAASRRSLRACAYNQPKVEEAPVVVVVLGYHTPYQSHLDEIVAQSVALGAYSEEVGKAVRASAYQAQEYVTDRKHWATRSTMLAAATLMIAAESLGVSSAPMEGFEEQKVKAAFGVPDDHSVCCLIALGYSTETPKFPGRLGLSEVCYEDHFGRPWTLGEA